MTVQQLINILVTFGEETPVVVWSDGILNQVEIVGLDSKGRCAINPGEELA